MTASDTSLHEAHAIPAPAPTVLANATLVLPDSVMRGRLAFAGDTIAAVDSGASVPAGAIDCDGDLVMPGLVELHTDNLERHLEPRPGVTWPHAAAIVAHDAELAGVGITTVFDAMRVGFTPQLTRTEPAAYARALSRELGALRSAGALRIDHFLHLRAELCSETLIDELAAFAPADSVRLLSLMDHTPGARQHRDMDRLRTYLGGKHGLTDAEFDAHIAERRAVQTRMAATNEAAAVAEAARLGAVLASHDDTTEAHAAQAAANGARLAEFPTSLAAAHADRAGGLAVMAGAPNVIRGGSHSGNVAALDLAGADALDILSSDYVPAALLAAALTLGERAGDLARGVATVTAAPAAAAGLDDRGRLTPGVRADVIRVARVAETPVVRGVWVAGRRAA